MLLQRCHLATACLICFLYLQKSYGLEVHSEPILPIPQFEITQPDLVTLGEKLFHDTRFSSDNSVSCASCHNLSKGGVDNKTLSLGVDNRKGEINTPTVFNSSLNIKQFWDGRAADLFDQIDGPVTNPKEMNAKWDDIVSVVENDTEYPSLFKASFSDGVTVDNIKLAITKFEESLLTPNSRFDRYLQGDDSAINNEELSGYILFKQYGCVSCHQGVAIGGNMFQKLGIMQPYFTEDISPADLGRFNVTNKEFDRFVFKVPSLRNIALTAPYLHDGSAESLEDVVQVMMFYQLGAEVSETDIALITSFLKTLTGEYKGQLLK